MSDTNGVMQRMLSNQGDIKFEAFQTSKAKMFGQMGMERNGYGPAENHASGFFMVVKTKDGSMFVTRQSMETVVTSVAGSNTISFVPSMKTSMQVLSKGTPV
ncbi:hypothetical protein HYH03_011715 [Edaphochlamys debaryana]|uniref:Uncharacterized protein n=1 Tax=Edaphochlamys debaryana TaxID=47281 RepID=A0A835XU28_9CHLO|nr:hypothetical protein HYH03_011715 [Edaphochlamys debaryana]|eukprot:KAG2489764.1 hypothetical protein HYH03_011715 [Edaphochlamys debaryana]